jgi:hypothetical protein
LRRTNGNIIINICILLLLSCNPASNYTLEDEIGTSKFGEPGYYVYYTNYAPHSLAPLSVEEEEEKDERRAPFSSARHIPTQPS